MPGDITRPTPLQILLRIAVQVTLGLYVVAASAAWWALPGGFPVTHIKFWANSVIPFVLVLAAAAGLMTLWTNRDQPYAATMASLTLFVSTGVAVSVVLFPLSSRRFLFAGIPLVITHALFAAHALWIRRPNWQLLAGRCCVGVASASVMVFAQQGPTPQTRPQNSPLPVVDKSKPVEQSRVELNQYTTVDSRRGAVIVRCGKLRVECQPLLTLHDHSPDRCWSNLRPKSMQFLPPLQLLSADLSKSQLKLAYSAETFLVADGNDQAVLQLEAFRRIPQPVYSHLNSFCELTISGHERLSLSFSPCPDKTIEPLPADYPIGRPARMAYRNTAGEFHVVEASSGEKGPFQQLAQGRIERDEPLSITLHDMDRKACRIVFDDWSAQADTQLSPTAGWGLPVNSAEFQRSGDRTSAAVKIWISLAATSVGRGWDTVGHAPGVYRNRMRIETIGKTDE